VKTGFPRAPKYIWEKESISQKESMIGTGPFLVTRIIKKNKEIVEIKTRRFVHYHKQTPFIKKITFSFRKALKFTLTDMYRNKIEMENIWERLKLEIF
jgi:MarR-like DNA-binding transcriptional regulator SgrR of sgrS sRNA